MKKSEKVTLTKNNANVGNSSLRRKRTKPGYVRLRNSAQIRVLESRRVLHNVYLILIGVKLRSILDEFWLGVKEDWGEWTPNQNSSNIDLNFTPISIKYTLGILSKCYGDVKGWLTMNNRILHPKQRTFIILRPWRILHAVLV